VTASGCGLSAADDEDESVGNGASQDGFAESLGGSVADPVEQVGSAAVDEPALLESVGEPPFDELDTEPLGCGPADVVLCVELGRGVVGVADPPDELPPPAPRGLPGSTGGSVGW
jgi:hypothetical protein